MAIPCKSPVDLGSNKITNLADPTSAQDAATKAYADSLVGGGGLTPHGSSGDLQTNDGAGGLGSVTQSTFIAATALDTDGTLAANSNSKVPSQAAMVTYVAAHGGSGTLQTPDTPPASPDSHNDEFTAGSLDASWTLAANTANAVSFSGLVPSSIHLKFTANQVYTLHKALVPGASDFSVMVSVCLTPVTNFEGFFMYVGDNTSPYAGNGAALQYNFNSSSNAAPLITASKYVSSVQTVLGSAFPVTVPSLLSHLHLLIQRVGGTYSFYYSMNGSVWTSLATAQAITSTVAHIAMDFNKQGATTKTCMSIDFVRVNAFFHPV